MKSCIKKKIIETVNKLDINTDDYRPYFSNPEKDFTRNRSISLSSIVKVGMIKTRKTLNGAMRCMFGLGKDRATASAFIQQREKLTLEFYRKLFENSEKDYVPINLLLDKYLVVAVDGSDINIFPNSEDKETSLVLSNNPHERQCNQVHLSALVAVLDSHVIDYCIQDYANENEEQACALMMEKLIERDVDYMYIVTCDRGYESYYLMMLASSLGLKYCIRIKDTESKGGICLVRKNGTTVPQ